MKRKYETKNADIIIYGTDSGESLDLSLNGLKKVSGLKGTLSPVIGFSDLSPIAGGFPNGGTFQTLCFWVSSADERRPVSTQHRADVCIGVIWIVRRSF